MAPGPGNGDRMYRRLEVPPEASAQQIRRAYRRLAHDMHPDTNPEDPEAPRRFQEITEAYELLSSPERRARYDRERQQPGASEAGTLPAEGAVAAGPGVSRLTGWVATSRPTVIGTGRVRLGSIPLAAGPVRVTSPSGTADHVPATSGELARLIEAIWEVWGMP